MTDRKFCSSCGTELNIKGSFCPNCGNHVNGYSKKESEIQDKGNNAVLDDIRNKMQNVWTILKWVSLGLGGISVLISFGDGDLYFVALGCFFGIVSRIMQAEEHRQSSTY